ncbi:TRAP transporter small permease [Vibrio nitrifigilis]|uniref:TRAP transporter small permease protein n=1 Tax=Vibrio nitrifigilis TaxID=2789781 RepID=A0ABS0GEM9_9VIBR|nr:TRAP transporter small permease [Vibrio nitrifigilis]MBF9000873.1 TRAP transporter small permease [Vibrio nitrifigilis]
MRLIHKLESMLEALVAIQLLATILTVFSNIVLRFFFNSGIPVTDEISRIIMGSLIFTGAVLALSQGSHISMTLAIDNLSIGKKKAVAVIVAAAMIFCDYLLASGAWSQATINMNNNYPLSGLPACIPYVVALICGGVMAVQTFLMLLFVLLDKMPVDRFSPGKTRKTPTPR